MIIRTTTDQHLSYVGNPHSHPLHPQNRPKNFSDALGRPDPPKTSPTNPIRTMMIIRTTNDLPLDVENLHSRLSIIKTAPKLLRRSWPPRSAKNSPDNSFRTMMIWNYDRPPSNVGNPHNTPFPIKTAPKPFRRSQSPRSAGKLTRQIQSVK